MAEEQGVRMGIHPDDPPQLKLAGVPRCIFSSFDGYQQAMDIADSPNIGICFCIGCWLEGGALMGKSTSEALREFGRQNRSLKSTFATSTGLSHGLSKPSSTMDITICARQSKR